MAAIWMSVSLGLGGLWRIVWCMVIGVIGAVKVLLCEIEGR